MPSSAFQTSADVECVVTLIKTSLMREEKMYLSNA
jgi:hypothetical protein